ncbi:unnamed protein product [Phytomonas sp. EM1]|nr:unnamed protein product [Phytomonas sp. EM1]|eukprot:CCW61346.1 unnamed protein product [Phytomonas sp. isolate EM1]
MSKLFVSLAKPIIVPVSMCARNVAKMDEALKRHIIAYEASGRDVCRDVWYEYISWQIRIIPYRFKKLTAECRSLVSGDYPLSGVSCKDFISIARFATNCLMIFISFVMLGRCSIFPLLEPGSPFVEEIINSWHINRINQLSEESISTLKFLLRDTN